MGAEVRLAWSVTLGAGYTLGASYTWLDNDARQTIEGGGRDEVTSFEQTVGQFEFGTATTSIVLSVYL